MSTPEREAEAEWDRLYIGGEWREASSTGTIPVENPATREVFTEVPAGTRADVDAAYEAAAAAQPDWADRPREERNEILENAIEQLNAYYEQVTDILATEVGTTAWMRLGEFAVSIDALEESIDLEPPEDQVKESSTFEDKTHYISHEPAGVVGVITAWNVPLHLAMRAAAPALALGNAVVIKPSPDTPVAGGLLPAKLFDEAGLPDGVLNVVTGPDEEIGDHFSGHPVPRVISFTGSSRVGRRVGKHAAESLALPALELGGNCPYVVTEDVDVEAAARAGAYGTFFHQGQGCVTINRHLVHEDVHDEYVDNLVEHAESLVVGDPSRSEEVTIGPVQKEAQREKIMGFIERTVEEGATVETGGEAEELFVEPTVITGCTNDMPLACNEHFGPVAPVITFTDDDEAIELANDTEYGLSAAVRCRDLDRARSLADRTEAGMVHVNDQPVNEERDVPFGGVKSSGLGRFHGEWIAREYTEPRWTSVQEGERDYQIF
jgi:aldehyde dehydrogenase (NAD+)